MNRDPRLPSGTARELPSWLAGDLEDSEASLLDVVDHVLHKGCLLRAELVLGLAGVDLVYVELTALLCSAERILGPRERDSDSKEMR